VRSAGAWLGTILLLVCPAVGFAAERLGVAWHPSKPRNGDVAWVHVKDVPEGATAEGSLAGHPLAFFAYAGGQAALVGLDMDMKPGGYPWRIAVVEPGREPRSAQGRIQLQRRAFPVERLTLPHAMVDLDPATERRAAAESRRLMTIYRTITPERFWRGRFARPVGGGDPGTGFGARRVINGQPRLPHGGIDYSAPRGAAVVAVNDGRVALVGDFFFHGRLVVLDHGLGLHTLYFHLDGVSVVAEERVVRGQLLGTVGASGRATGPHLHFGAQIAGARVDPVTLFGLAVVD